MIWIKSLVAAITQLFNFCAWMLAQQSAAMIEWLATTVTRHRYLTGLFLLVATAFSIAGHLYDKRPDPGKRVSNRPSETERQVSRGFSNRAADCLLVIEVDDLFTPKTTSALREVARELNDLPYVDELTWVDTIPVLNVFGLRDPLLPPSDASVEMYDEVRDNVMKHPLVRGQLMSDDAKTLLMTITFDWLYVTSDDDCSTELLRVAKEAAARSPDVDVKIQLTGTVPLYIAYQRSFDYNHRKFQYISYSLVLIVSLLLFRGLRAVIIVASAPTLGIVWTLGLLNYLDELSNPLTSVVLPVLLTMVALTDGIHLMVHIRRACADGMSPQAAAASAIRNVGTACALTSLTTAIGFGSLLVTQSEIVRGFGRGCAIGVVVTFVAVVTTIPFLCSTWFGRNVHKGHEGDLLNIGMDRFAGVVDWVIRRGRTVSVLAIVTTIALLVLASRLRPDDRAKDRQPIGSPPYQALAHCDEALGGIQLIQIIVNWDDKPHSSDEVIAAILDVQDIVDHEESLRHPTSILNILSSFPGDEPVKDRLPFLELLPKDVKTSYFDAEHRQALMTVRIQDLGIARYGPVFRRVEDQFAELEEKYKGFHFRLSGDPIERSRNLYTIVSDLASSLITASLIILVVMGLVYRSLRVGLITVIPNLFPLAVTAAMMVVFEHPLEIASVCAFTVCLGIAVDDTIHFLTCYRTDMDAGVKKEKAIHIAFQKVGTAMVVTTVILIVGFGTVLTSELPGQRYFAAMAVSTIGAALVGDLIFLPALLARYDRE